MNLKKTILLFLSTVLICSASVIYPAAAARSLDAGITDTALTDGTFSSYANIVAPLTLSAEDSIGGVYIIFRNNAVGFTASDGESSLYFDGGFLQYYAPLSSLESDSLTLTFDEPVDISDIYVFGEGELPEFVHTWNAPWERADLLLFSTHADDEQLFFAGVLPYYAGELEYRVQVAYFTDHVDTPSRRQELLNGLWTVGVRNYPVISVFPDQYSESYDDALANLNSHGFTEDDVLAYQAELLRRFKPLVAVGHDLKGEYSHGQHILNATTLTRAVELAADPASYPTSADKYGTWDTPKLYLHLYEENAVIMDWDIPLESFGGKTAFQMTQEGFLCHKSQQFTWFTDWLNGENGNNTSAASIKHYSPCKYGLYRSTVGEDVIKNDFFENITIYSEQERIEKEEEEVKNQEEEAKRAEEESKAAEESSLAAMAETKIGNETQDSAGTQNPFSSADTIFIAIITIVAVISVFIAIGFSFKNKKRRKH